MNFIFWISVSVLPAEDNLEKREVAIMSSKDDMEHQFPTERDFRAGRLAFGNMVVYVTTLASPVYLTTKLTVSSAVVNADPAQLQCLPPSATIC